MIKVYFAKWDHVCKKCGSSHVEELLNLDFLWHAYGYYCDNCDDIYVFEEVKHLEISEEEKKNYIQNKKSPDSH